MIKLFKPPSIETEIRDKRSITRLLEMDWTGFETSRTRRNLLNNFILEQVPLSNKSISSSFCIR